MSTTLLDRLLFVDLFAGMGITALNFFRKKDTVEYPEAARTPSDRFRGMFQFDENRCIKCGFCAMECPIAIIHIEWHSDKDESGKAIKILDRYDIDVERCMFCGLCEEACPTKPKSIWLTSKTYEMSTYDRQRDLYFDKGKLRTWPDWIVPFRPRSEARR